MATDNSTKQKQSEFFAMRTSQPAALIKQELLFLLFQQRRQLFMCTVQCAVSADEVRQTASGQRKKEEILEANLAVGKLTNCRLVSSWMKVVGLSRLLLTTQK